MTTFFASKPMDCVRCACIAFASLAAKSTAGMAAERYFSTPMTIAYALGLILSADLGAWSTSKADEDIYKSYDLGVNSYIVKPVTFEALVDILQTLEKYWFEIVELPPDTEK